MKKKLLLGMILSVGCVFAIPIIFSDTRPNSGDPLIIALQRWYSRLGGQPDSNDTEEGLLEKIMPIVVVANAGSGSQTPWTADIDAAGFKITGLSSISIGTANTNGSSTTFGSIAGVGYTTTNNADGNYRESLPASGLSGPYLKLYGGSNVTTVALSTYVSPTFNSLTDGSTITWTVDSTKAVQNATVQLGGNRTLAFSGLAAGMTGTLIVKQDGTGSRTLALPANSKVISGGSGAVTLTTTAGAFDILTFISDGTNTYWNVGKNYN